MTTSAIKTAGSAGCSTPTKTSGEPRSVYLHLPFCRKRCNYCHFFISRAKQHAPLILALKREWKLRTPPLPPSKLRSIYLGGGTPSLVDPPLIADLLIALPKAEEVTLEANPEDVTLERMAGYRVAGVNRVSLGVQTLDDGLLQSIGRSHTAEQAIDAIEAVAGAGITNISVDLILELPNQTVQQVRSTIDALVTLPVTHLSLYNLTIEPPAPFFYRGQTVRAQMPQEPLALEMLQTATTELTLHGFSRYEISAFSRGPFRSVHNSGYWQGLPCLGLGPSAFSYTEGVRSQNVCHLDGYLSHIERGELPTAFSEALPPEKRRRELLAIGLRLLDGIDLNDFQNRHGMLSLATTQELDSLASDGLLKRDENRIRLSERGIDLHDYIASCLV